MTMDNTAAFTAEQMAKILRLLDTHTYQQAVVTETAITHNTDRKAS